MSAFVPPTWFGGLMALASYIIIPLIIGFVAWIYFAVKDKPGIAFTIIIICLFVGICGSQILWHENYEVPSVNEKVITVADWQPKPNLQVDKSGMMVIDSADDLLLVTSDGESFLNEENFWFGKFDTRDVLHQLKENGTYKIKYYGWREGFNSGFPNILSVEEVVDESNVTNENINYFGTKVI